jgi:glutamate 5-kinase
LRFFSCFFNYYVNLNNNIGMGRGGMGSKITAGFFLNYCFNLDDNIGMGRGGMGSKITAALVAANGGVTTCVASGYDLENIKRVFSGDDVGTLFPGRSRPNKRQRWLTLATGR